MMRKILLGVLVLSFIGCGLRSDKKEVKKQPKQSRKVAQGVKLLSENKVPEAIQSFNQAIQQDPNNVDNYIVLGQVYYKLGNYAGAEDVLKAAQKLDPNNGEIYFQLSQALGRQEGKMNQSMTVALLSLQHFSTNQDQEGANKALYLIKALGQEAQKVESLQEIPVQ